MTLTFKRAIGKIVDAITSVKSVIDYIKTKIDIIVQHADVIRNNTGRVSYYVGNNMLPLLVLYLPMLQQLISMLRVYFVADSPRLSEDISEEKTYRGPYPIITIFKPIDAVDYVKIGGLIAYDSQNGCRPWAPCFRIDYDDMILFIAKKVTVKPKEGQTVHVEQYITRG